MTIPLRKSHIHFFMKVTMKKGIVDIELMKMPIVGGDNGLNKLDGY